MKWIEEKMKLLGVATNPNYKIAFYVDYLAMISVHVPKHGLLDVRSFFKFVSIAWINKKTCKGTIFLLNSPDVTQVYTV